MPTYKLYDVLDNAIISRLMPQHWLTGGGEKNESISLSRSRVYMRGETVTVTFCIMGNVSSL